ncbi:MAG: photosynthetic complex assembly protein PuhC [Pseudomonadota bacterium]
MSQNSVDIADRRKLNERDKEMIPTVLVRAMFGLALLSLVLVTFSVLTDRPHSAVPPITDVAKERSFILEANDEGYAFVKGTDGALIAELDPDQGGFIAGVVRGVSRKRIVAQAEQDAPVRLVQFTNGRIMLFDDASNFQLDLNGFGAKHHAAFAKLFDL